MSKKNEERLTPREEARVGAAMDLAQQQVNQQMVPQPIIDFAKDLQTYVDEFDRSALQIPFLRILQANSPVCTAGEPTYDENARPGMFLNTVTGDLARKIEVIPVYHYSTLIEWVPRSEGGGFVKDHGFEEGSKLLATTTKRPDSNRDMLANGNDLVRTEVYFVLIVAENGELSQAMITMTSTQLKKSRNWNSRTRLKVIDVPGAGRASGRPMFFHSYRLSTVPEKNDFGNWMGYLIEDGRPTLQVGEYAYLAAKEFRQTVEQGIKSGTISMKGTAEETTVADEAIPF